MLKQSKHKNVKMDKTQKCENGQNAKISKQLKRKNVKTVN